MRVLSRFNQKGFSLMELLVALVISALVIAGIYKLFIFQSRAYTVQGQAVEVQQNIRMAMEILLRDLRMAGFDNDNDTSTIEITTPVHLPVSANAITVDYEYYNKTTPVFEKHTVAYWRDGGTSRLMKQLSINDVAGSPEILLDNVDSLDFTYGVDVNNDGAVDDQNGDGTIDNSDWIAAALVGNQKVIGVRVVLTARPDQANEDVREMIRPRTLDSAVTLRNLCLK